jgi:uncharacterized protein (TIGR03435 family)
VKPAVLILALVFVAQAAKPSFEVASVKPSTDADVRTFGPRPGGRFIAKHLTLRTLISRAYGVHEDRISGAPDWTGSEPWSIEAKAAEGSVPPGEWPDPAQPDHPLSLMLQSLLEDRFRLKVRRETREVPVYELVVLQSGTKMKATAGQEFVGGNVPRGTMRTNPGIGYLAGNGVAVAKLVGLLSEAGVLGRPVIDKTGLAGAYDFVLEWAPGPELGPVAPNAPTLTPEAAASRSSIFAALQEQLGLKAESAKGPVGVVIVEHVERPSAN